MKLDYRLPIKILKIPSKLWANLLIFINFQKFMGHGTLPPTINK